MKTNPNLKTWAFLLLLMATGCKGTETKHKNVYLGFREDTIKAQRHILIRDVETNTERIVVDNRKQRADWTFGYSVNLDGYKKGDNITVVVRGLLISDGYYDKNVVLGDGCVSLINDSVKLRRERELIMSVKGK